MVRRLGAQPQRGARGVHGRVAAADHDDVLADPLLLAEIRLLQEVHAVDNAVDLLAGHVHGDRVHAAGADDHRVVALLELVHGDVTADLDVVVELHAVLGDPVDVELDDIARQPEGRDADERGAAARRQRLVDVHLVAVAGQLLGDGQPGRPRADDRHALAAGRADHHVVGHVVAVVPVDQEALHGADRERLVDVSPAAGLLAWCAADVAADGRHRVGVAGQDVALLEATLGGEHQVAPAVGVDRAAFLALDVALQASRRRPRRSGTSAGSHSQRSRALTVAPRLDSTSRLRVEAAA